MARACSADFRVRQPERGRGMRVARSRRRDQEMLCTAAATRLSPPTSSSVWCRVPGLSSRAAMTVATSARRTVPLGSGGGCEPDPAGGRSVGQAARAHDGPVQVPGAQIGLGGGLRRNVSGPDLTTAGLRRRAGSHRGDLHESADPGRSAASAISTEVRPVERSPCGGRWRPASARAANTTASAPDSSTRTSPVRLPPGRRGQVHRPKPRRRPRAMPRPAGTPGATEDLAADSGSGADVQMPSLRQKRDCTRPGRATHGAYRSTRSVRYCSQSWRQ